MQHLWASVVAPLLPNKNGTHVYNLLSHGAHGGEQSFTSMSTDVSEISTAPFFP